jgi:hypothetical protein
MTAHQIARFHFLAVAAYDRGEYCIETLSSLVRALRAQAEVNGIKEEYKAAYIMIRDEEGQ